MENSQHIVLTTGFGTTTDVSICTCEGGASFDVYIGVAPIERVGADPGNLPRKMLVGRMGNANASTRNLSEVFQTTPRTIKRWGDALLCGDMEELTRVFAGRGAWKKVTPELIRYGRQLYRDRDVLGRNYRQIIINKIREVFEVSISRTVASAIFKDEKAVPPTSCVSGNLIAPQILLASETLIAPQIPLGSEISTVIQIPPASELPPFLPGFEESPIVEKSSDTELLPMSSIPSSSTCELLPHTDGSLNDGHSDDVSCLEVAASINLLTAPASVQTTFGGIPESLPASVPEPLPGMVGMPNGEQIDDVSRSNLETTVNQTALPAPVQTTGYATIELAATVNQTATTAPVQTTGGATSKPAPSVNPSSTPMPIQALGRVDAGKQFLHHAGQVLFAAEMSGISNPFMRQMIGQLLQGALNIEQSKQLCVNSLARFTGLVLSCPAEPTLWGLLLRP